MSNIQYYYATGRRKVASARIWLSAGNGTVTVNSQPIETYFRREVLRMLIKQPFDVAQRQHHFDVRANVVGGGLSGQAGAIRHGIARALTKIEELYLRSPLKKEGFLTRDSRQVERKKYGRSGARKRYQYSKR